MGRRVAIAIVAFMAGASSVLLAQLLVGVGDVRNDDSTHSETFRLGGVELFPLDEPVYIPQGRFWLVRTGTTDFVALSERDPGDGCEIPWMPGFLFEEERGWFRNPCHGQTYDRLGECVFGPCNGPLKQFVASVEEGVVTVEVELP